MSIRDVKATIASNQDEARTCAAQLMDTRDRLQRMRDQLQAVAVESASDEVEYCLAGFDGAGGTIEQVIQALHAAQARADEYAARI